MWLGIASFQNEEKIKYFWSRFKVPCHIFAMWTTWIILTSWTLSPRIKITQYYGKKKCRNSEQPFNDTYLTVTGQTPLFPVALQTLGGNKWGWRNMPIFFLSLYIMGFPGGTSGKEPACQCRRHKRCGIDHWVRKIPWRRAWQATPGFLSGESHGQRNLAG